MQPSRQSNPTRSRRGRVWMWILVAIVAIVLLVVLSPVIAAVSLIVLVTAIVALAKRTPTWLRLHSRRAAIAVTAAAATVLLVSGSVSAAVLPRDESGTVAHGRDADRTGVAFPGESGGPEDGHGPDAADAAGSPADATASGTSALALLATLPVKGRAPMTGYDRAEFGQRWLDVDRNGCDTRNDILARDLGDVTTSGPCKVLTGVLDDPYTATEIDFQRGADTSALVQIDHVVALGDAWQKGAQQLTADARAALANDPVNLLAVSEHANLQKSDGDAATWLPANKAFRCEYVARQISVKAAYGLWVTQAEHDAMERVLEACPDQTGFSSALAAAVVVGGAVESAGSGGPADGNARVQPAPTDPAPAPRESAKTAPAPTAPAKPKPAPTKPAKPAQPKPKPAKPKPKPAKPTAFYANCTAARAAGVAPLHRSDPGYSSKLDRDGDGIACE